MQTLFNLADVESILARIEALKPDSPRRWGKMNPAQALAHLAIAMDGACDTAAQKQFLIGRLLAPFILGTALGEKPFSKGSPTDPTYVVPDARDFAKEKARLLEGIDRFVRRGSAQPSYPVHPFFGRLSGEQWGRLTWKHLDHHLRQFGA
jgi:hypothetical protein